MVVNATLAAMAKHGGERKAKDVDVYHVTSSNSNPILLSEMWEYVYQHFNLNPLMDRQGRPVDVKRSVTLTSMEVFSSTQATSPAMVNSSQLQKKTIEHLQHLATIYEPYLFFRAW